MRFSSCALKSSFRSAWTTQPRPWHAPPPGPRPAPVCPLHPSFTHCTTAPAACRQPGISPSHLPPRLIRSIHRPSTPAGALHHSNTTIERSASAPSPSPLPPCSLDERHGRRVPLPPSRPHQPGVAPRPRVVAQCQLREQLVQLAVRAHDATCLRPRVARALWRFGSDGGVGIMDETGLGAGLEPRLRGFASGGGGGVGSGVDCSVGSAVRYRCRAVMKHDESRGSSCCTRICVL